MKVSKSIRVQTVCEFNTEQQVAKWQLVDDGAMDAAITCSFCWNPPGTATFKGEVPLESSSGFACLRRLVRGLDPAHKGLIIKVKGHGQYFFKMRTDPFLDGINYQYSFKALPGNWQEIYLPFSEFKPFFRGLQLTDAPALNLSKVQQIGILFGYGQAGPFHLEIAWIRYY